MQDETGSPVNQQAVPDGGRGTGERKRDPRIDPKRGDVLLFKGHLREFTVDRVYSDGSISGHFHRGIRGSLCGLKYWRETMAVGAAIQSPITPSPTQEGSQGGTENVR